MSSNQREPILVSFDFKNKEIRVSAFTLNGNHRDSITKPLQCFDLKDYNPYQSSYRPYYSTWVQVGIFMESVVW